MPNHVINELVFADLTAPDKERLLTACCGADGKVDFAVLVPTPLNMWWGSVGSNHEAAFKRTALDWSREHWGTKWNAYGHAPHEDDPGRLVLRFQTAWRPPYPWLAAVFNHCKLSFDHNWLDEGACSPGGVSGRFDYSQVEPLFGNPWREAPATDDMQRHLHKLLWGVEEFAEDEDDAPAPVARDGEGTTAEGLGRPDPKDRP